MLQQENILFSFINNEKNCFYIFNDCVEKLIEFLNIGLPIERILLIFQKLFFSNFSQFHSSEEFGNHMRRRLENQIQIDLLV